MVRVLDGGLGTIKGIGRGKQHDFPVQVYAITQGMIEMQCWAALCLA
jgi:hypothetical protein|tara:strand:- start:2500 stop:2640 length:141 start_codon:yes stop_codon:yes gene_type:complete